MSELKEMFESLSSRFNGEAAKDYEAVLHCEVTGGGSDHWTITIKDGVCTVTHETPPSSGVHFQADVQTLRGIISGEINSMSAFMSGKLKIDGDILIAQKFNHLFTKE